MKFSRWIAIMFVFAILFFSPNHLAVAQDSSWCDGFDQYAHGTSLPPPWVLSGNTGGAWIDSTTGSQSDNSLRMYGSVGGCWGVVAVREYFGFPLSISLAVKNGTEDLYGCHPFRAQLGLRSGGTHWSNCPCPALVLFMENGDVEIRIPPSSPRVFSGYSLEEWHTVSCSLWLPGDSFLHSVIWINGDSLGEFTMPEESWMHDPAYIDLSSQEGTVWFDNVCVNSSILPTPSFAAGDNNCDGIVNIVDVILEVDFVFRGRPSQPPCCEIE